MRDRRGSPGTCLAKAKREGEDPDKRLCRLRGAEEGSPASWAMGPAVGESGNSQNETLSLEMTNDVSEVSLSLHRSGNVFPYLKESGRRNSAPSKTAALLPAPAEGRFAGPACGVAEASVRDWLGGGPRATDRHRRLCHKGEPCGSGLPCCRKRSEGGVSEDEPPSACLEGRGSVPQPACLRPVLSALPRACPAVLPGDETACAPPAGQPVSSEHAVEYKETLRRVRSSADDLRMTLVLLAVQALKQSRHAIVKVQAEQ